MELERFACYHNAARLGRLLARTVEGVEEMIVQTFAWRHAVQAFLFLFMVWRESTDILKGRLCWESPLSRVAFIRDPIEDGDEISSRAAFLDMRGE
jgi:hypothetical protein